MSLLSSLFRTTLLFVYLSRRLYAIDVGAAPVGQSATGEPAVSEYMSSSEENKHLVPLDDTELFLLRYIRQARALGKKKGGGTSYANYGMPEYGYQQYFLPHPGKVLSSPMSTNGPVIPPMERVDPYSVEGFYAPALWQDEYMSNRHIGVASPAVAHASPYPNVYAAAPPPPARHLKKNSDSSGSYYGLNQYFLPHPAKNLTPFPAVDYSRYVVLGGPHEFGTGMYPDRYRTDGIASGDFTTRRPMIPPLEADMDGIFPSPSYARASSSPPEYISGLYHSPSMYLPDY